jgi:hypothetical protein
VNVYEEWQMRSEWLKTLSADSKVLLCIPTELAQGRCCWTIQRVAEIINEDIVVHVEGEEGQWIWHFDRLNGWLRGSEPATSALKGCIAPATGDILDTSQRNRVGEELRRRFGRHGRSFDSLTIEQMALLMQAIDGFLPPKPTC